MNRLHHIAISLFLAAAILATPVVSMASPQVSIHLGTHERYHDRYHNDDHEWTDDENQHWIQFRNEHHMKFKEYRRANRHEQDLYWEYRHHSDDHNR